MENVCSQTYKDCYLEVFHDNKLVRSFTLPAPLKPWDDYVHTSSIKLEIAGTGGLQLQVSAQMNDRLRLKWSGSIKEPTVLLGSSSNVTIQSGTIISAPILEGNFSIGGESENNRIIKEQRTGKISELELSNDSVEPLAFSISLPGECQMPFRPIPPSTTASSRIAIPFFWMARTPVTVAQYLAVMRSSLDELSSLYEDRKSDKVDPSRLNRDAPVTYLNWSEAEDFCNRLTKFEYEGEMLPARFRYRLPTVDEWECACCAGNSTDWDEEFQRISRPKSSNTLRLRVGSNQPNDLGLCDMVGFVWQWCRDPSAEPNGNAVCCGGSAMAPEFSRCTSRQPAPKSTTRGSIGFRPVLVEE